MESSLDYYLKKIIFDVIQICVDKRPENIN